MILWRISNHATLDGSGGLRAAGRWHTRGQRVAYCSPNPATALLEILVHAKIDLEDLPINFRYLEIEAPDDIREEAVNLDTLGLTWKSNVGATRAAGNDWLRSGRSAILRVPSAIVPATWNALINPAHAEAARIRIVRMHDSEIDARLLE